MQQYRDVPVDNTDGVTRRQFLNGAGMAATACVLGLMPGCSSAPKVRGADAPLVGSQLYGWGQYYDRAGRKLQENLDEALAAIRDCGYDYAEGSLDLGNPENNLVFAGRCKARGLRMVSFYTGGRLHDRDGADRTVSRIVEAARAAREAGCTIINCNPDPIGRDKTDDELAIQVAALKSLGGELRGIGMHLGIHHHTPELRNRAREFHYNFRETDPAVVGFCYDVHWVYRGGLDPMEVLPEYGSRVVSWHLRQSREGVWWEDLDTGDIDYSAVARHVKRHRLAPFFTVELALETGTRITRTVVENHQRSREFVRAIFAA